MAAEARNYIYLCKTSQLKTVSNAMSVENGLRRELERESERNLNRNSMFKESFIFLRTTRGVATQRGVAVCSKRAVASEEATLGCSLPMHSGFSRVLMQR